MVEGKSTGLGVRAKVGVQVLFLMFLTAVLPVGYVTFVVVLIRFLTGSHLAGENK